MATDVREIQARGMRGTRNRAHVRATLLRRDPQYAALLEAAAGDVVADAIQDRYVVAVYQVADLCESQGRLRRMVRQYAEVLGDGLHALRHDRPNVTEEFLDRAVEVLSEEVRSWTSSSRRR